MITINTLVRWLQFSKFALVFLLLLIEIIICLLHNDMNHANFIIFYDIDERNWSFDFSYLAWYQDWGLGGCPRLLSLIFIVQSWGASIRYVIRWNILFLFIFSYFVFVMIVQGLTHRSFTWLMKDSPEKKTYLSPARI